MVAIRLTDATEDMIDLVHDQSAVGGAAVNANPVSGT